MLDIWSASSNLWQFSECSDIFFLLIYFFYFLSIYIYFCIFSPSFSDFLFTWSYKNKKQQTQFLQQNKQPLLLLFDNEASGIGKLKIKIGPLQELKLAP